MTVEELTNVLNQVPDELEVVVNTGGENGYAIESATFTVDKNGMISAIRLDLG